MLIQANIRKVMVKSFFITGVWSDCETVLAECIFFLRLQSQGKDRAPSDNMEVRGRGRGWRGRGGGVVRARCGTRATTERLVLEMSLEEQRELTAQLLERQLGLRFDTLMMH